MNKEPIRIAYLVSHPIQYQSPLLRLIAAEPGIALKAFYRSPMGLKPYTDEGFGQVIAWDTPLLEGFEHEFLPALDDPMRVTRYLRPLNYGLAKRLRQGRFDVLWVHGYARVFNLGAMLTAKRLGHEGDAARRSDAHQHAARPSQEDCQARFLRRALDAGGCGACHRQR